MGCYIPIAQRRRLAIMSALPTTLRRCVALPDGTATIVRTHGALAAPAHGRARSCGIFMCA
jgi:hypothetical protein